MKIVLSYVNNAAQAVNNAKVLQIFVLNAQIHFKIFSFQLEHALINVPMDNSQIKVLAAVLTVIPIVKFVLV
jgi:hypothetical protein